MRLFSYEIVHEQSLCNNMIFQHSLISKKIYIRIQERKIRGGRPAVGDDI